MSEDLLFDMADKAVLKAEDDPLWKPLHDHLMKLVWKIENNGWKRKTGMTQHQKLLAHFKKAGSITVREAMVEYSIQSLTKRIQELRDRGFKIKSVVKYHPVTQQKYVRYVWAA